MELEYFNGFPYMITVVSEGLFHLTVLPADSGLDNLREIVRWQVNANKLQSCLVVSPSCCIYFGLDGAERVSGNIPRGGINCSDLLRTCRELPVSAELTLRRELLQRYIDRTGMADLVYGDLAKGGRRATPEELQTLRGRQPNGVPLGLAQCGDCGEWRGESLDPNPRLLGLVIRARCRCENDTFCAACGQPFGERRINANYYKVSDDRIHQVPGFVAFEHQCTSKSPPPTRRQRARAVGSAYARVSSP